MEITLKQEMFVNNKYMASYGNREALFTIIDEEFAGNNTLGKINRITVMVRILDKAGKETGARMCTTVIGLGDGFVGVYSGNPDLKGKVMTKDNMDQCAVILYEDAAE